MRCLWMVRSRYEDREKREMRGMEVTGKGGKGRKKEERTGYAVHASRTRMELFRHSFGEAW